MKKLLIAYDGSDSAREAMFDLRRAGLPGRCAALVYSVADVPLVPAMAGEGAEYAFAYRSAYDEIRTAVQAAQRTAEQGAEFLKKIFPDWHVETGSHSESPSQALVDKVHEWKPDLLVIGSHSHAPWGRLIFGSVSMNVLNAVPCDVRIGRGKIEENVVPARLVAGIDGSVSSLEAVEALLGRQWPKGTAVHFITAVDTRLITSIVRPDGFSKQWVNERDPEPLSWVYRMLHHFEDKARGAGLLASSIVRQDDPKDVLLDEAARWGSDCIFVGSRGLGLGQRMVLGSVSTAVAARAHCSVEVVKGG